VEAPKESEEAKSLNLESGNQAQGAETDDALLSPVDQLEKPRPRRLSEPTRTPNRKGKTWEEDDEMMDNSRKSAKAGGKAKKRPHIIGEDDDDFGDELDLESDAPATISLSLVRPPKPKSAQIQTKPTPTPTASRKPRSDNNRERQRRNRPTPETEQRPEKLMLETGMTVQQLSEVMVVPETEIIKNLFFKGIMATITQTLDIPTIELVAQEYGIAIEEPEQESKAKKTEVLDGSDLDNLHHRPPVVTVMGHVDHGKTTLLDAIRKTKVAQGEAGGITQHIGAYHVDVEHGDKVQQVVFLDTPGHEAFTAMRARGTRVTDIAILVVAADDGVRPQTIEAISHAKAAEVPLIVAVNKVDKEEAQPDRVKQELMEHGLVPEEWGGDTIVVPVSAIQGENLDTLLEMILLVAEVEELNANPDREAKGTIIEAHLDKARGPVASLLVQNGTLRVGDVLVAGSVFGKVRAMIDDQGHRVEEAGPSIPVEVLGLGNVPGAGEEFQVFWEEKEARSLAIQRTAEQRTSRLQRAMSSRRVTLNSLSAQAQEGELKELNLLLKADVQGSLEAILGALEQLPQKEVQLRTLLAAPGEITETDVDLAAASGAVILGFSTTLASGAKRAADEAGVDVREYDIIYKLLEDVQGAMEGMLEPELVEEPLGQAEVRALFPVGRGVIAGCYIQSGKVIRNCNLRVHRGKELLHTGSLNSLRRMKEDAKEVNSGYECGIGVDNFNSWQEGDIIETYRMVTKRRTLSV
jgi:translation initiation factor IF-2